MTDDELIALAATGSAEAQWTLVDVALSLAVRGVCSRFEAAAIAETFARMAASHGGTDQRLALAGVLLVRAETLNDSDPARAHVFKEDAAAVLSGLALEGNRDASVSLAVLLSEMAGEGDDFAGQALQTLAVSMPLEVMREAAGFDRLLRGDLAGTA